MITTNNSYNISPGLTDNLNQHGGGRNADDKSPAFVNTQLSVPLNAADALINPETSLMLTHDDDCGGLTN